MKTPLESKIDKLIAANPELLKPLLIKAIEALNNYDILDHNVHWIAPLHRQNLRNAKRARQETLQEINNALVVV